MASRHAACSKTPHGARVSAALGGGRLAARPQGDRSGRGARGVRPAAVHVGARRPGGALSRRLVVDALPDARAGLRRRAGAAGRRGAALTTSETSGGAGGRAPRPRRRPRRWRRRAGGGRRGARRHHLAGTVGPHAARERRRRAHGRRDRASVVVGDPLSGCRSRCAGDHGQRAPHSSGSTSPGATHVARRHSQLLGPCAPRQDGLDPRSDDRDRAPGGSSRHSPGAVRRVLRHPARSHGVLGDRRLAR